MRSRRDGCGDNPEPAGILLRQARLSYRGLSSNRNGRGADLLGPAGDDKGSLTGQYSINSAYYFPWVQAPDPLIGSRIRNFPPCGFVAGIYAATDANRGVWKAPAGIDASLTGASGLQYALTNQQNSSLKYASG